LIEIGLTDVLAQITRWSAEASQGAPVADSQLVVLAATGKLDQFRAALDINKSWRLGLARGDARAVAGALEAAAGLVLEPAGCQPGCQTARDQLRSNSGEGLEQRTTESLPPVGGA
jgi:hypothetical protein